PRTAANAQRSTPNTQRPIYREVSSSMTYQVQKRKQKHPDDIDKMPVQAGDLDGIVIAMRKLSKRCQQCQNQHDSDSNSHENRVQPGHPKVNPKKYFGVM